MRETIKAVAAAMNVGRKMSAATEAGGRGLPAVTLMPRPTGSIAAAASVASTALPRLAGTMSG